mgnify:CR=1 FL=1
MSVILPNTNMTPEQRKQAIIQNTKTVTEVTVAKYFTTWMTNFRVNLPQIWQDADISEIPKVAKRKSCVVIGGGPSLKKFNHLEVLAKSKYAGTVFCCDKMLKPALTAGVKVDYVANLDSSPLTVSFIDHVYSPETALILTTMAHPDLRKSWSGKVYWLVDDLASCAHSHSIAEGLAIIANKTWTSSGASVGSCLINMAFFTEHRPIALIGMDMGYDADEPLESTPYWEGHMKDFGGADNARKAYIKGHNPFFGNDFWIDWVFEIYRNETLNRIRHFKMNVLNCSGQGSLFGDGVKCMNFAMFLKQF